MADKTVDEDFQEKLKNLTEEEAAMFVRALELAISRRRNMLIGYVLSLIAVILGMVWALYMYGTRAPGSFRLWVFLVPPTLAGIILITFGKLTRRQTVPK